MSGLITLGLAAAIAASAAWGQQWRAVYAHNRPDEQLVFTDLAFPSSEQGVAVGVLRDRQGRDREAIALLTSDGGRIWNQVALEEIPVSLFFLDAARGWLVTTGGIWRTEDSGLSWTRLSRHAQNALTRVWFLNSLHGFAVGREKTVLETHDGGTRWTAVPEAAEPVGDPSYTAYTQIAFADDRHGLIVGAGVPPNAARAPRQAPTMTVQLQTLDGGLVWAASAAPLFGQVSGLRLTRSDGLIVFAYADTFPWPAEVYRLDLRTGRTTSVYKQKDRAVTGIALFDGKAFLAVTEPKARANPARGKVRILTTTDFLNWSEMKVDQRASGSRVYLAGPDPEHLWAATDAGVLLRLAPGKN